MGETEDDSVEEELLLEKGLQQEGQISDIFPRTTVLRFIVYSMALLLYSVFLALSTRSLSLNNKECVSHLSAWSPALEAVKYETITFNGSFWHKSPFKGASPEVDTVWDNITLVEGFTITPEDLAKLHKSTSSVQVQGKYLVSIEIFHQLHCLNMLRKVIYKDYYADKDDIFSDMDILYPHVDHCIDMLRIVLQCSSDVTLLTNNWVKGVPIPTPDFNTVHKCRNFDEIWEWAQQRAVRWTPDVLFKPEDAIELEYVP